MIEGELVKDAQFGLGLREADGTTRMVIWPYGYAARSVGIAVELVDDGGSYVARDGDRVRIGGGEIEGGSWLGCGGTTVVTGG